MQYSCQTSPRPRADSIESFRNDYKKGILYRDECLYKVPYQMHYIAVYVYTCIKINIQFVYVQ